MDQPPRNPREAILSPRLTGSIVGYGLLISLCTLGAYWWAITRFPQDQPRASTVAFMTLAFAQILHLGNARSALSVLTPRRAFANRYALAAVGLTGALQLLTLNSAPLARVLRLEPIGGEGWLVVLGFAVLPALAGQLIKTLRAR